MKKGILALRISDWLMVMRLPSEDDCIRKVGFIHEELTFSLSHEHRWPTEAKSLLLILASGIPSDISVFKVLIFAL